MAKIKLNQRLDEDVVTRLMLLHASQKIPLSDLISNALDALERDLKLPETLAERVDSIESALMDLTSLLQEKMEEASVNEKERLKSMLQLFDARMQAHDQAEQARFEKITRL